MRAAPIALVVAALTAPAGTGQTGVQVKVSEDALKQFADKKEQAKKTFTARFDAEARRIGATPKARMSAAQKHGRLAEVTDQKAAFLANGSMPTCDEMLDPFWDYMAALHAARRPVAATYDRAITAAVKAGDGAAAKRAAAEKEAFDRQIPGRGRLAAGTKWHGSRHMVRGNVDAHLVVHTLADGRFEGTFRQNNNKSVMKVSGTLDGAYLQFQTTSNEKGAVRLLVFGGFVLADRVVLGVGGIATNGGRANGLTVLNRE